MAKLPNFKRIFKTDYDQKDQDLVEKLAVTINNGFELLYNQNNRGIDLSNNLACTVRSIEVIVNSSGIPTAGTGFTIDTSGQIKGTQVLRAVNLTNSSVYPTSAPFISFTQDNKTITINHIAGLPANNKFSITLVAWA